MPTDVQIDWNRKIQEWKSLQHGQKDEWFMMMKNQYFPDKSLSAVQSKFYYEKRKRIGKSKESPKETDPRKLELCKVIVEMKERGKQRADTERELPTELCIRRLVQRGIMQEGELSASHANTLMREKLAYREETPRTRWEVDRALAEVQIDGSISKYYRPWKRSDSGKLILKASGRPLRYKGRDAGHTKLVLWQGQDKYSRLRTVRGVPGKAESTGIMLAHMHFWLNRQEDEHLMRHLPWSFAHDNASLFRTQEWKNLMRSFGLTPGDPDDDRSSMPYEKTGIGSVERSWQNIWTFEMALSEDYEQIFLDEYNMLLHEAMIAEQKKEHPYYSGYRGDLYQQSLLNQKPRPRVLKADVFTLAMKRFERTVTSELTISIDGTPYRIPQYYAGQTMIGKKVTAWKNWRGELVAELTNYHCEQPFTLERADRRMKGDFAGGNKRTYQQKVKDMIADGDSMYDAVMSGRMAINNDGEYVDQETGEVLGGSDGKPKRLMPADEEHVPDSPFADDRRPPGDDQEETFGSVYEAKVWIGKQLQAYGYDYEDVKGYFDPKLEHEYELRKDLIAEDVEMLTSDFNAKSKTA